MSINFKTALLVSALALAITGCQKPAEKPAENTDAATTATDTKPADNNAKPAETPAEKADAPAGEADVSAEIKDYRTWVEGQIDSLLSDTEKFVALLKEGKTEEAKKIYPHARMYYERSEPIAESFGDLDPKIDNRKADLKAGEVWSGFHKIEEVLWTKNTTKGTEEDAKKLISDIKELRAKLPTAEITGKTMVQGAVDLLNEVSTSKITGEEEIFSRTDLYDFKANIEGAEKIFEILKPKLEKKDPKLAADLTEKFKAVNDLLDKHKVGDKDYKPYNELTKDDTKALAEAVNKLGEPLGQMGTALSV